MNDASRAGLEQMLRDLVVSGRTGDRLPTVRALMSRFGVSQGVVQNVLEMLQAENLITAQVGRGTFIAEHNRNISDDDMNMRKSVHKSAHDQSVLMLSRHIATTRSRRVSRELQNQFADEGVQSLQVTYSDVDHALRALRKLPRFDACVLQSHFELVNIDLLWFLRQRSQIIVLDGATITGIDVDSVASNWRDSLDLALQHLLGKGHKRIAFATSSAEARPIDATRQHYESMRRWRNHDDKLLPPIMLDHMPGEEKVDDIFNQLSSHRRPDGKPDFSALMIWGVTDGSILVDAFQRLGWRIPEDLSVVVLGHVDIATEHRDFFTIAGTRSMDAVDKIRNAIARRLADPNAAFRTVYLDATLKQHKSVRSV